MEVVDILGWIALMITLIYTGLGLPAQIRKNLISRSTGGLSLFMTVLLFLTFSPWVAYGLVKPDWYIFLSGVHLDCFRDTIKVTAKNKVCTALDSILMDVAVAPFVWLVRFS